MKLISRFLLPSLFVLILGSAGFAQTTGTLTGTVTTEGAGLPGVLVTISSPSLQGTRTAVTGDNGSYNFPALPPGIYTVRFELTGMQTVTKTVRVILAETARADAELKLGALAEAITITAAAPAVLETPQIATNLTGQLVDELPVGRDITSTVLLAPGVNTGQPGIANQVSISGGPGYDNLILVDGVVVNENLRAQIHDLFIEAAIEETTVLTGSVSAEYGRFTGGVISTVTKSGGNEFTGSLRDGLTNPDWTKKTPFPGEADHIDDTNHVYEATLGGYVLRDRLWFFTAGRKAKTSTQRFTSITNLPYNNAFDETRLEGKLTGQITPKHSLIGTYIDRTLDEMNNAFSLVMDLASLVPVRSLPNTLLAINYNGILTNNLAIEAQYSDKYFAFQNSGSRFTDRIMGTLIRDIPRGTRFHSPTFCGICGDEERNNESYLAKGTYFLTTPNWGSHNIVFGAEDFMEERLSNNYQSGSNFRILARSEVRGTDVFPIFDATTTIVWTPIFALSPGTDFETRSVFINDKWDFSNHWTFNIGVRYDQNDGKDADGNTVSDDSAFGPRLAAIYDIGGDGRMRFSASYARYVSKIADGNVGGGAQAAGNPGYIQWNYRGPVINGPGTTQFVSPADALRIMFEWFDSVGGTNNRDPDIFVAADVPGFSTRFDEPIVSPSVDEFTVGYGMQLGRSGYAKIDLINKEWRDFYAARLDLSTGQVTDQFGNVGDQSVIVNEDAETEREYRGIQLQGQWRPGRFHSGLTYTWAELEGNDESEAPPTATSPQTPLALWYPEYLAYPRRRPVGFLTLDQRHRAKAWIGYDLPTPVGNFNFSLLQSFDSGSSYSAIGQIDATGRLAGNSFVGAPTNPGYKLSQIGNRHNYFFSDRGEFRTDDVTRTDLAVNYELPIRKLRLFINADVLNVFDEDAVVDTRFIESRVITRRTGGSASGLKAFNPFTETPIECPRGEPASVCSSMGANYQRNARFGQPTNSNAYQLPFTYRFAVGIRF